MTVAGGRWIRKRYCVIDMGLGEYSLRQQEVSLAYVLMYSILSDIQSVQIFLKTCQDLSETLKGNKRKKLAEPVSKSGSFNKLKIWFVPIVFLLVSEHPVKTTGSGV